MMRAAVATWIPVTIVTLALLGCTAQQAARYERRIHLRELARDIAAVSDGWRLLAQDATQGRFGCSLAIAKLAAAEQAGVVKLVALTPAEEAYWTNAVCGVSELGALQFISPISVRPAEPGVETLCAAARSLEASLLLLYAPNRYGPNTAQVLGVIYDLKSGRPIASLHASASIRAEGGEEVAPDRERGDQRQVDAYYQASRAFEQYLLACLNRLIANDSSPPTTQPHRWSTPASQRWWLPQGRWAD